MWIPPSDLWQNKKLYRCLWIAVDADGDVYGYEAKPIADATRGDWVSNEDVPYFSRRILKVEIDSSDWWMSAVWQSPAMDH